MMHLAILTEEHPVLFARGAVQLCQRLVSFFPNYPFCNISKNIGYNSAMRVACCLLLSSYLHVLFGSAGDGG